MSAPRPTAIEQLDRLLYLIPAAAREGGCALDELATRLDTTPQEILDDLEAVTARAYYHPAAGTADDLQILVEGDRVGVWTTGEFRRPVRLGPLEALCLALGLRRLAAERGPEHRAGLLEFATRLERAVATAPVEELLAAVGVAPPEAGGGGILGALREATSLGRRCRIRYEKPGAEPEWRTVRPYALVSAAAGWYLLAHCEERDAVRAFRVERVLEVELLPGTFDAPADFDPDAWIDAGGRVYRGETEQEEEVRVRYSPRIAAWIREQGPVEEQPDGSVVVTHRVADPGWVVRHVLGYGAEAEVLSPPEARERVSAAVARMAG